MTKAARVLNAAEAQLVPVTATAEFLQTVVTVIIAWLSVVSVIVVGVGVEMWRQWRQDVADERRATWMGSVSSLNTVPGSAHDDGDDDSSDVIGAMDVVGDELDDVMDDNWHHCDVTAVDAKCRKRPQIPSL